MASSIIRSYAPRLFLWGHLKSRVYKNYPKTIQQLNLDIIEEINSIRSEVLFDVMKNMIGRVRECFSCNGDHIKAFVLKLN